MQIIDGKKIRDEILEEIKKEVSKLPFVPIFCDILVGDDPVSKQYVDLKAHYAQKVGMSFHKAFFESSIETDILKREIEKLNKTENMCGIIAQLPLPEHIDQKKILNTILPELDVDCLGEKANKDFYDSEITFGLPTAMACIYLLDSLNLNLKNKKIVVLGQGELVGKPVTALLKFRDLDVVSLNSRTENKENIIKEADIIISGIGKGKYITGDMIKNNAIIIDAGTSEMGAGVVGDVDFDSVKDKVSFITPVPGGVGPVTVAMLLRNVLEVAKKKNKFIL